MPHQTNRTEAAQCFAEKAQKLSLDPALLYTEFQMNGSTQIFIGLARRLRAKPIVVENKETQELTRITLKEFHQAMAALTVKKLLS